jgi:hypothetical protein
MQVLDARVCLLYTLYVAIADEHSAILNIRGASKTRNICRGCLIAYCDLHGNKFAG